MLPSGSRSLSLVDVANIWRPGVPCGASANDWRYLVSIESMIEAVNQLIAAQSPEVVVGLSVQAWHEAMNSLVQSGWSTEFSCNDRHEVWPVDGRGYSKAPEREITPELTRLLAPCVRAYLAQRPEGGRFQVSLEEGVLIRHLDGARLAGVQWLP